MLSLIVLFTTIINVRHNYWIFLEVPIYPYPLLRHALIEFNIRKQFSSITISNRSFRFLNFKANLTVLRTISLTNHALPFSFQILLIEFHIVFWLDRNLIAIDLIVFTFLESHSHINQSVLNFTWITICKTIVLPLSNLECS